MLCYVAISRSRSTFSRFRRTSNHYTDISRISHKISHKISRFGSTFCVAFTHLMNSMMPAGTFAIYMVSHAAHRNTPILTSRFHSTHHIALYLTTLHSTLRTSTLVFVCCTLLLSALTHIYLHLPIMVSVGVEGWW